MARARDPISSREVLRAIAEVEQALALDPEFKEAWVLDSHIRNYASSSTRNTLDEHRPRGE